MKREILYFYYVYELHNLSKASRKYMAVKVITTLIKAGKNVTRVTPAFKGIAKAAGSGLDLTKIASKINIGAFASTFKKTIPLVKNSSNLMDAGKVAKKFSKAVPASTDDILTSINPSVIKNSSFMSAGKKLTNIESANLKSLDKLDNTFAAIKRNSKTGGVKGLARRSDNILGNADKFKALSRATLPVNKIDDVGDALKKGKGALSKVDDVADKATDVAKKSSKKIDDVAGGAKKASKTKKAMKFLNKNSGKLNIGVMAGYYLGIYVANKVNSPGNEESHADRLISDPVSDAYPVTKYDEISSSSVETDGSSEITLVETLQRKDVIGGVLLAVGVVGAL